MMTGDVKIAVVSGLTPLNNLDSEDYTKSGFGTVKGCIVIVGFDESDDSSSQDESACSIGFSDFTQNFGIGTDDADASAKVDCLSAKWDRCYVELEQSGGVSRTGLATSITDGVRLTNNFRLGSEPRKRVYIILFGGADITISLDETVLNTTVGQSATITPGTGFDTSLVFFIGVDRSAVGQGNGINNSFGVCHINAPTYDTFTQRCMGWSSDHNNASGSPSGIISTDRVLDILTETAGQDWAVEVTAAATNSITITTRENGPGTGMEIYSFAVDLDDRKAKVGSVEGPTSGSTWSPSVSLGFKPQIVGLGLTDLTNEDTISSDAESGVFGVSANAGAGEEFCLSWYNEDGVPTTNTSSLFRSRAIDLRDHDVSTVLQDHSHLSFDSGGWTYTINTENETVAKKWFYWAIEEAAGAAAPGYPRALFKRPETILRM